MVTIVPSLKYIRSPFTNLMILFYCFISWKLNGRTKVINFVVSKFDLTTCQVVNNNVLTGVYHSLSGWKANFKRRYSVFLFS